MIELHDRPVVLQVDGRDGASAGWDDHGPEEYQLEGAAIAELAAHFGVPTGAITVDRGGAGGKPVKRTLNSSFFPIARRAPTVIGPADTAHHITKLQAAIEAERILYVRFWSRDIDGQEEQFDVTYLGSFSVWWKAD